MGGLRELITKGVAGTGTDSVKLHEISGTDPRMLSGGRWALRLASILLSVPLILRAYIGTLTRFTSDDFCWPKLVSDYGFIGLQVHLYTETYGRWAASVLQSLTSYAGSLVAPFLPTAAIVLCTAGITWFLYEISHKLVPSLVVAEIIVIAFLTATPRLAVEPLYWQSALLTYFSPFVIGPLGAALAIRFKSGGIAGIAACLTCGFNEASCVMVLCGLIAAIPFVARRGYIFAALTGAFLSTALVAASPGNVIRRGDANLIPDPLFLIESFRQIGELLWSTVCSPAGALLFVLGMAVAPYLSISRKVRPLWTAFIGLLLALSAVAASVYGINTLLARTSLVPSSALVATIFILGLWAGGRIVPRHAMICLLCTVLFVIATGSQSLSLLPLMQKYARSWEVQNKTLEEAAPDEHVTLNPSINPFIDAWQIKHDPNWPINRCIASYYGVASVQISSNPKAQPAVLPREKQSAVGSP
jgi:hypothetical protein